MSTNQPTTDDGDIDYEQMVKEMGLDKRPFITDPSGEVRRVIGLNKLAGDAWLRDARSDHRYAVPIEELYAEWSEGDLKYREAVYIRDDQRVVGRDLLLEALAIADSEFCDMLDVDPDQVGEWTQRVRVLVEDLEAHLEGER